MSKNIIQSFMSQTGEPEKERRASRDQEVLAEELASAVVEVALREACRGQNADGHLSQRSAGVKLDGETDPGKEIQTPKDTSSYQSGLPAVGSLDYPNAPPTSPLLPELQRSRSSFARKLKGGLATVFLPSPPPPTPKDKEDGAAAAADPQVELIEHLMHSLSTDGVARDGFEVRPHHGAKLEAFAEALSRDVIGWVLSDGNREQIAANGDLHLLAHRLVETIITSSLHEARLLV